MLLSSTPACLLPRFPDGLQQRTEAAAKAVLDAAKKAGAAGELLSPKEQQAVAQSVLNPPKVKEEPKVSSC
jgi:hypothetical protein